MIRVLTEVPQDGRWGTLGEAVTRGEQRTAPAPRPSMGMSPQPMRPPIPYAVPEVRGAPRKRALPRGYSVAEERGDSACAGPTHLPRHMPRRQPLPGLHAPTRYVDTAPPGGASYLPTLRSMPAATKPGSVWMKLMASPSRPKNKSKCEVSLVPSFTRVSVPVQSGLTL